MKKLLAVAAAVVASVALLGCSQDSVDSPTASKSADPQMLAGMGETVPEALKLDPSNFADGATPAPAGKALAAGSTYDVSAIPFAPEAGPFANDGLAGAGWTDDVVTGPFAIGFDLDFYGNTYSQFYVSSNGFIQFGPGLSQGCCSGRAIPLDDPYYGGNLNNLIAIGWSDIYPPGGGSIRYETRGTAPNRRLIVSYDNLGTFPYSGVNHLTAQAILHENGTIELHTTNLGFGSRIWTQGLENADGTEAAFVPGRVAANFSLSNDAIQFSTGPTTKDDCKGGGWEQYGFRNQGQCVRFIETGKDSR